MKTARWQLVEHILLRRAGFPIGLLDAAATPGVTEAALRAATCELDADRHRSALLEACFPAAVERARAQGDRAALRTLSRWRRAVGRRRVVEMPAGAWPPDLAAAFISWREASHAAAAACTHVAAALAEEAPKAAGALRERASDERVREAVLLLSPDAHDAVVRLRPLDGATRRAARDRSKDRVLYRYLQRLAAKNETTSFFGPLTYVTVQPSDEVRQGPEAPGGIARREVFASFWAVATIARAAARDAAIRAHLPVRRAPLAPRGDDPLLELVDGQRTTAAIASAAGMSVREADRRLADLQRRGIVRRDLEPLSTTPAPLADLAARLPAVRGAARWHAAVAEFQAHLDAFAAAPYRRRAALLGEVERWFTDLTGRPARRGGGEMYADRGVLYEECLGDTHPFVFPEHEADRISARLAPVLDLCATYGRLRHEGLRSLATSVLAERGGRMSFVAFAEALAEAAPARPGQCPHLAAAEEWLAALTGRVAAASDGHVARLGASDLADLVDPGEAPRFVSPDVLLERADGGAPARTVLGELHPYVAAWGSQGLFAPDQQALQAAFRRDLRPWGGAERMVTVLRRRRHKGLVTEAFPGRFVEVSGLATHDARRRVPIDRLWVAAGPDGPRLRGPGGPLTLYCGEDDHLHLQVLAPPQVVLPPVRLGEHTPRLEVDGVVVLRERWRLPPALRSVLAAAGPADLLVALARARLEGGWPRHCFAHGSGEPKPLYLDLDSALAADVLRGLAAAGEVTLVEAVPAPERLWLQRSDGAYTSELRVALVRS